MHVVWLALGNMGYLVDLTDLEYIFPERARP